MQAETAPGSPSRRREERRSPAIGAHESPSGACHPSSPRDNTPRVRPPKLAPVGLGRSFFGLLPHELFFGLFLVVMSVRLISVEGVFGRDSLLYLGLIAANVAALWFCRARDTGVSWRIAMLFYPIAMNLIFTNMKVSVPRIHEGKLDWLLQTADT